VNAHKGNLPVLVIDGVEADPDENLLKVGHSNFSAVCRAQPSCPV
jgi:hypothetical protein